LLDASKTVLLKYQYEYEYTRVIQTKERVMLTNLESWFFKVTESLKQKCFEELAFTKFRPKLNMKSPSEVDKDYNKLKNDEEVDGYYFNIIEELNDFNEWCISEKTFWGIPIPYFYNKNTKKIFTNQEIARHVAKVFREQGGSDAWYTLSVRELLPDAYKDEAIHLVKGDEVFDVWFDNSLTWKTILNDKEHLDENMLEQEKGLDSVLASNDQNYRTQEQFLEEYDRLNPQDMQKGGRKSVSKMYKANKERKNILNKYEEERNHYLSRIDIDTFKNLIPQSMLWEEEKIKSFIDSKSKSTLRKVAPDSNFPANIVVEGFDQHLRWFLTSSLTSVALTASMPFQTIKTHGIVVDGKGDKMSKTMKNYIDPRDISK